MAIALKGEASFPHDGEVRTIRFDVAALLEFEDATGVGLFELDGALGKLGMTAELLRAGLGESGRTMTREDAAAMLFGNPEARSAVVLALSRALPESKAGAEGDGENPPKAARKKAGTGPKS